MRWRHQLRAVLKANTGSPALLTSKVAHSRTSRSIGFKKKRPKPGNEARLVRWIATVLGTTVRITCPFVLWRQCVRSGTIECSRRRTFQGTHLRSYHFLSDFLQQQRTYTFVTQSQWWRHFGGILQHTRSSVLQFSQTMNSLAHWWYLPIAGSQKQPHGSTFGKRVVVGMSAKILAGPSPTPLPPTQTHTQKHAVLHEGALCRNAPTVVRRQQVVSLMHKTTGCTTTNGCSNLRHHQLVPAAFTLQMARKWPTFGARKCRKRASTSSLYSVRSTFSIVGLPSCYSAAQYSKTNHQLFH